VQVGAPNGQSVVGQGSFAAVAAAKGWCDAGGQSGGTHHVPLPSCPILSPLGPERAIGLFQPMSPGARGDHAMNWWDQ